MNEQDRNDELLRRLDNLSAELHSFTDRLAASFATGEIYALNFDGKAGIAAVTDDKGSNALAYGIYNNTDVELFVAIAGGGAQSGLAIPKRKLVVAPITVNGAVQVAANATQLAETKISVLRWRFPTPQPFFVGSLS